MGKEPKHDRCIKTEKTVNGVSIYVIVMMSGECPTEVQVSVAPIRKTLTINEEREVRGNIASLETLANDWLGGGLPVSGLIRFFNAPPCRYSGVIGEALIAAMEAKCI